MPFVPLVDGLSALVFIGACLSLQWVLVRWYDAPPGWALGLFVLLIAVLLGPSLAGVRVALPLHLLTNAPPFGHLALSEEPHHQIGHDLILEEVPWQLSVRRSLAGGEWPLWEPNVGAGMPVLGDAQAQAQAFQPITALALLLPLPGALAAIDGLRLLVALVFCFVLLRRLGCGGGPAFYGAVSYGFGGFLVLWLGWPIASSAAVLPFLLYAIVLTAQRGVRRDVLLLAVAAFSTLLVGHPETTLYVSITAAAVASYLVFRPGGRERWRAAGRWAGAGLLAAGCAAPALLPLVSGLPETHRAHLVEMRNERFSREDPLAGWRAPRARHEALAEMAARVGQVVAPHAVGSELRGAVWRGGNLYLYGAGFIGSMALALAFAGLWPGGPRLPLERALAWVALPLLVVLARPPGLDHLLAAIPVLDRSPSHHARVTLILGFVLSSLAAMALERWRRRALGGPALLAGAVIAFAAVSSAYLALAPEDTKLLLDLRLRSWWLQGAVTALGAGALALAARRGEGRGRDLVPAALGVVAFLELAFFFGPAVPSGPRGLYLPETASLRFLREHAGSDRIVGMGDVLRPNLPSAYGLADPRISNPSKPWSYTNLMSLVSRNRRETTDVFRAPTHPLYRLLGVRYVLVRKRFSLRPLLRQVFVGDGLRIYEYPDPLPRLFLPRAAEAFRGSTLSWMALNPDFGARSLVARTPGGVRRWRSRRPEASALTVAEILPSRVRSRALLVEPRLLASSIYQDGGWRLLVDGRPAATVRTNAAFVGAWLPAGEHRLDLLYRPGSFVLGCLLAGLALGIGIAWLTPPPRTEVNRRAPAPSP